MSQFDSETAIAGAGDGHWITEMSTAWNIGDTANGGYALSPVVRALRELAGHPDPISVTTHFLRPVQGGGPASIDGAVIRRGRTVGVARGVLTQAGQERLTVLAAFGDLATDATGASQMIDLEPPSIPRATECVDRMELEQGVELPITGRLDVRIHPDRAVAGASDRALTEGWIRFRDGTPPCASALPLFADAFPPSLFARFGRVGWVPTIELTVHVRRRPVAGWVQARFECDDLTGGRMIETGTLWDESGRLVARSRQLGLLLS